MACSNLRSNILEAANLRRISRFSAYCQCQLATGIRGSIFLFTCGFRAIAPDWKRILLDFQAFTEEQLHLFGDFPVTDYHFLNQILPYRFYHGVEHGNSTVITLGPGELLMTQDIYKDLLGVSSHELFHTWNITNPAR